MGPKKFRAVDTILTPTLAHVHGCFLGVEPSFHYFIGSPTFLHANRIPVDPKIILLRNTVTASSVCQARMPTVS